VENSDTTGFSRVVLQLSPTKKPIVMSDTTEGLALQELSRSDPNARPIRFNRLDNQG
jgi:hypothetical protein